MCELTGAIILEAAETWKKNAPNAQKIIEYYYNY